MSTSTGLAGVDDGKHAVVDAAVGLLARLGLVAPELPLLADEDVLRPGERGHPRPVHQARVPAHVVDVHVRAQHVVDLLRGDARRPSGRRGTCPGGGARWDSPRGACRCRPRCRRGSCASGVRTTQVWMREPMSPVVSSKKWGLIHERWAAIRPGSEPGQHHRRGKGRAADLHHAGDRHRAELDRVHGHLAPRAGSRPASVPASSGRSSRWQAAADSGWRFFRARRAAREPGRAAPGASRPRLRRR